MRVDDSMVMETGDINFILAEYLRFYRFHSKNKMPISILVPTVASILAPVDVGNPAGEKVDIPVKFVPVEETIDYFDEPEEDKVNDTDRPLRASGDSDTNQPSSSSDSNEPEPDQAE